MKEDEEEGYHILAMYHLFSISDENIDPLRQKLLNVCKSTYTLGTLLVTKEGINGTVCTPYRYASRLMEELQSLHDNNNMKFNVSYSSKPVFDRLRIRRKVEVVTMGQESCCGASLVSSSDRGIYITPEKWNDILLDDSILVVDTRNDYEIHLGTFQGAVNPKITSFSEFPDWLIKTASETATSSSTSTLTANENKKYSGIAMFCTGGIRCEKSTSFCKKALQSYFGDNIYHLEGGILRYLKEIPPEKSLWVGECFVFDHRIAVTHGVKETGTYMWCVQCKKRLSKAHESMCSVCYRMGLLIQPNNNNATTILDEEVSSTTHCEDDDKVLGIMEEEVLYYVRNQQQENVKRQSS